MAEVVVPIELTDDDWKRIFKVLNIRLQRIDIEKLWKNGNKPIRAEKLFEGAHGGGYSRFYQTNLCLKQGGLPYRLKTNDADDEAWFGSKFINFGVVLT